MDIHICNRALIIGAWIICFQDYMCMPRFYINAGICELGLLPWCLRGGVLCGLETLPFAVVPVPCSCWSGRIDSV